MMKKLLILALASSAAISSPAFAQSNDGLGEYVLSGEAKSYCVFGFDNNWTAPSNVLNSDGAHNQGLAGADGTVKFDIQAANDTIKAAGITFAMQKAICNEPFKVTATSTNGGLKSPIAVVDTDFTNDVNYNAQFAIDGQTGPVVTSVVAGTQTLLTNNHARAGLATLKLDIPASSKFLLKSSYTDTLLLIMQPGV